MELIRYVPFDLSAVDAACDILELTAAEGRTIELIGFHIGKMGGISERLKLTIKRFDSNSTSGSSPNTGGGPITPTESAEDGGDDGFTAEAGNETRCSGGTITAQTFVNDAFDASAGFDFVPADAAEPPSARDGKRIVIGLETVPSAGQQVLTGYATVKVR